MDKRSILAMVLCIFIFIGWMWLQNKIWPPPKAVPPPPKTAPADPAAKSSPEAKPKPETKPADPAAVQAPPGEATVYPEKPPITLASGALEVVLTNKGAGVERLTLHYPKGKDAVPILHPMVPRWPHLAVRHVGGPDAIESLPWEIVEQKPEKVEFRYRLRNGVEITKIIALESGRHTLQMTLLLANRNPKAPGKDEPAPQEMKLEVLAFNGLDPDSIYRYELYMNGVYRYNKDLQLRALASIEDGEKKMAAALAMPAGKEREDEIKSVDEKYFRVSGGLKEWVGIKNRFFTALMLPDGAALDNLDHYSFRDLPPDALKGQQNRHNIMASAVTNSMQIGSAPKVLQFSVYAGPLEKETLRELPGAEDLGGYTGGCSPLAFVIRPATTIILELLHFTAKILHNMGVAIIVTTLLIRLCLFPLSLKSQRNAMQMQALAPKIQALKERYKDDQQKYGVEQMRLFKEHGVNPVAGCLPLLIQMPIFIGMYSVFEMSVMLRHAPFMLWIKDLSEPDRLVGPWSPFVIPLIITDVSIDALNLLPILMTITWFLQAYWTPRSPDPQMAQQQKMMMWMPIVFGFSCYGLASGLSLYFLANSLLSMGEQKIIKRYILKIGPDGKPLTPPAPESIETK